MHRTSAAVLLALFAGGAFAGQSAETGGQAGMAADAGAGNQTTVSAKFKALDTDGDGLLSRAEASADPTIASIYDSLDTAPTIEDDAKNAHADGVTLDQFEAGLSAAAHGGVVGASAAGGATYKIYPDGTMEKIKGTGVGADAD